MFMGGVILTNPFVIKLGYGAPLSDEDRQALEHVVRNVRQIGAYEDVIREGGKPDYVHVILEGFACRYKILPTGGRQIMAFLVPGDMCDLHVTILGDMDHSIGTLCPCKIAFLSQAVIDKLVAERPVVNRALWWATLVDEGTLREWLVSMGRRPADKQMAHLFCELLVRLESVGLVKDNSFEFPATQADLGDTLGLSAVHVNRVLQQLRAEGLVALTGKVLRVLDAERLRELADFDANYLHLNKRTMIGRHAAFDQAPAGQA